MESKAAKGSRSSPTATAGQHSYPPISRVFSHSGSSPCPEAPSPLLPRWGFLEDRGGGFEDSCRGSIEEGREPASEAAVAGCDDDASDKEAGLAFSLALGAGAGLGVSSTLSAL